MRFALKALVAMVAAFIVLQGLTVGFYLVVGTRMLEAAAWTSGMRPPNSYVAVMSIVALAAATLAGALAALIVDRARIRSAVAYGVLFAGLAAWSNRAHLFDSHHLDEWPLILAPLIAMPVGAWLVVRRRPERVRPEGFEPPAS